MIRRCLVPLLVLIAAGCAGPSATERDGPPSAAETWRAEQVPEAVPADEPRSEYGNPEQYTVMGQSFRVRDTAEGYAEEGVASWYGTKFHGQRTSSGEPYNMFAMTAAHTTLPLPTYVRVTNLDNDRSTVVKVNDRGPFVDDRIIDLSYAAASRLGMEDNGTARVRVEALSGAVASAGEGGAATENGAGGDDTGSSAPADPDLDGEAFIQLGAFEAFDNAQRMRAQAAGAGVGDVKVSRIRGADGGRLYRVRVGPLSDPGERDTVRSRLREAGLEAGRVVID